MKRFLKYSIIFILGFLAIFIIAYLCRPKNSENYLAAINHKLKLLDSVKSPRIIVLGGSNVCFGIDSKVIIDSIGLPVIDFGLHAGLGLKFYIDIVTQRSNKDDIIVIMPELQQFYGQFNGQPSELSPLFFLCDDHYKKDILRTLNVSQITNIIRGTPKAIYDIYRSKIVSDSIYNSKGFNEFGDHYSHWKAKKPYKFNTLSKISTSIDNMAIKYIKCKVENLRNRGNQVIMLPPSVTESYFKVEYEKFNELYSCLSSNGIDFSVPADAHAVPDEYCFDGIYHRDRDGVNILSYKIANELKCKIKYNNTNL